MRLFYRAKSNFVVIEQRTMAWVNTKSILLLMGMVMLGRGYGQSCDATRSSINLGKVL